MTPQEETRLQILVSKTISGHTNEELAIGFLRYEALRLLNARQYAELCKRNLRGEHAFDDLVDELTLRQR